MFFSFSVVFDEEKEERRMRKRKSESEDFANFVTFYKVKIGKKNSFSIFLEGRSRNRKKTKKNHLIWKGEKGNICIVKLRKKEEREKEEERKIQKLHLQGLKIIRRNFACLLWVYRNKSRKKKG
jgi:hypothetical protein